MTSWTQYTEDYAVSSSFSEEVAEGTAAALASGNTSHYARLAGGGE
jgi:hypothetical protein